MGVSFWKCAEDVSAWSAPQSWILRTGKSRARAQLTRGQRAAEERGPNREKCQQQQARRGLTKKALHEGWGGPGLGGGNIQGSCRVYYEGSDQGEAGVEHLLPAVAKAARAGGEREEENVKSTGDGHKTIMGCWGMCSRKLWEGKQEVRWSGKNEGRGERLHRCPRARRAPAIDFHTGREGTRSRSKSTSGSSWHSTSPDHGICMVRTVYSLVPSTSRVTGHFAMNGDGCGARRRVRRTATGAGAPSADSRWSRLLRRPLRLSTRCRGPRRITSLLPASPRCRFQRPGRADKTPWESASTGRRFWKGDSSSRGADPGPAMGPSRAAGSVGGGAAHHPATSRQRQAGSKPAVPAATYAATAASATAASASGGTPGRPHSAGPPPSSAPSISA